MSRPISPATAEIIRRVEPYLAFVEIQAQDGGEPTVAPGVVASSRSVALSLRFVADRTLEEIAHGSIRSGDRRWHATLTGMRMPWDTCCYSADSDDFPIAAAPARWSHTLQERERIVALTPRPRGGVDVVTGILDTLEPCPGNEPYERSQLAVAYFMGQAVPGALIFDSQARLAGVLAETFDSGGRIGAFLGAERLCGLPAVPLYMQLSARGLDAELLNSLDSSNEPTDPRVLGTIATAARRLFDRPLALRALDAILECDAEHAWAHFERAIVLQELARPRESARALERAIALDPESYDWRPAETEWPTEEGHAPRR